MYTDKSGKIRGRGSRADWKPPPRYGSGEILMGKLLQDNKIRFTSQVPIKTPYSPYTFLCDYLLLDKPIIIEVDGGLHRRTWGGRPARNRMKKDEAKQAALEAYGFKILRFADTLVKRQPEQVLASVKEALK